MTYDVYIVQFDTPYGVVSSGIYVGGSSPGEALERGRPFFAEDEQARLRVRPCGFAPDGRVLLERRDLRRYE